MAKRWISYGQTRRLINALQGRNSRGRKIKPQPAPEPPSAASGCFSVLLFFIIFFWIMSL